MQPSIADPVVIDVLWQGKGNPLRVRLELPDGSTHNGTLALEALLQQLETLDPVWQSGDPSQLGQILFEHLLAKPLSTIYGAAVGVAGERGVRLLLRLDERKNRVYTPFPGSVSISHRV